MITRLTVLYDANCGLCRTARSWLRGRTQLVPLDFVAAGSEEARRRYPALDVAQTLTDITVVADDGGVYTGDSAWIVCLWALDGYRGLAARLARPGLRGVARQVAASAGSLRAALRKSRQLRDYGQDCDGACDL